MKRDFALALLLGATGGLFVPTMAQDAGERNSGVAPITLAPFAKVGAVGLKGSAKTEAMAVGLKASEKTATVGLKASQTAAEVTLKANQKAMAVGLDGNALKLELLMARLREHKVTPQGAWEAGDLTVDDLFAFIESLDAWGGFHWVKDNDLRRQVVALLVSNTPKSLEDTAKLSPVVRLWLADYYGSIGDERCLVLADGIIAEFKDPKVNSDEEALVFQALERQAWFYRDGRQYEASAKKWASAPQLVSNTEWMIPDAIWQAGRMYLWGGKSELAEPYFAQVEAQENKFFVTMVTYDKVGALMSAGKNEQAAQLAKQTLQVAKAPVERAINLLLLSQALYAQGDFSGALAAAQECQEAAAKSTDVAFEIGFDVVAPSARGIAKWSQLWQKTPLICSPESLSCKMDAAKSSRKVRITVRSFKTVPLSVKCDDARVKCTVVPLKDSPWFPGRGTRFIEQIIEVEVPLETALQTELHISSSQFPGVSCDIPLQFSS